MVQMTPATPSLQKVETAQLCCQTCYNSTVAGCASTKACAFLKAAFSLCICSRPIDGHLRAEPAQTRRPSKQNVVDTPKLCLKSFCNTKALRSLKSYRSLTASLSGKVAHSAYSVPARLCSRLLAFFEFHVVHAWWEAGFTPSSHTVLAFAVPRTIQDGALRPR